MRAFVVSVMVLVLSACGMTGERRADGDERKREVADATAAWVAAYNSRDPARIAAMYDPEAVFWGTTSITVRPTPATIGEYFKDSGKRPDARVAVIEQNIRVLGDVGINTGLYTFSDVREGKPVTTPARYTFVFRKRDGRWLLVDHHSSRVPAP